jgi:hypothetical protein
MENLHAVDSWGILITQEQINKGIGDMNPLEAIFALEEADFDQINVSSGSYHFAGEKCKNASKGKTWFRLFNTKVWFWRIHQFTPFKLAYNSIEEVEREFMEKYPELAALLPLEPRLCRLNAVCRN